MKLTVYRESGYSCNSYYCIITWVNGKSVSLRYEVRINPDYDYEKGKRLNRCENKYLFSHYVRYNNSNYYFSI